MPNKQVIFSFPSDAWDGIVQSLTENKYQEQITNPDYEPGSEEPEMIDNPVTREEAATQAIVTHVEAVFKAWSIRQNLAPAQQAVKDAAEARAAEVRAATSISVTDQA